MACSIAGCVSDPNAPRAPSVRPPRKAATISDTPWIVCHRRATVGSVECPDPEALARLATADGDPAERAALADHAASCESCHAVVTALLGTSPALMETAAAADGSRHAMAAEGNERIDRYVVRGRLGAGGMGVVY